MRQAFWEDQIKSWSRMDASKRPKRMVCVTDDDSEHDIIKFVAGKHIPVVPVVSDGSWRSFPEQTMIITGSPSMLLSRALNRGYGEPPTRWPVSFGLLNNDVRWCSRVPIPLLNNMQRLRYIFGAFHTCTSQITRSKHNRTKNPIIKDLFDIDNKNPAADIVDLIGYEHEEIKRESRKKKSRQNRDITWTTLPDHLSQVVYQAEKICKAIRPPYAADLLHAARHHDWAKSHNRFQEKLLGGLSTSEYKNRKQTNWAERRPLIKDNPALKNIYHDLLGGCAMFNEGADVNSPLSSYLVLSHHGRNRTSIYDTDNKLPGTDLGGGIHKKRIHVKMTNKKYQKIFQRLFHEYGPFNLGYHEALLRISDIRACRRFINMGPNIKTPI